MPDDIELSRIAHALAHPARMRILRLLASQDECCGADIFSGIPLAQSTISEHLRVLRTANLVASHHVGTGMVYCLVTETLDAAVATLQELAVGAPRCTPRQMSEERA